MALLCTVPCWFVLKLLWTMLKQPDHAGFAVRNRGRPDHAGGTMRVARRDDIVGEPVVGSAALSYLAR